MKKIAIAFCALTLLNVSAQTTQPLNRVAFGSCNNEQAEQPMWDNIVAQKPDLWIWMGDNIYADTKDTLVLKQCWELQQSKPGYVNLVKNVPIIGTWDDHDFGDNDAGRDYRIDLRGRVGLLARQPQCRRDDRVEH